MIVELTEREQDRIVSMAEYGGHEDLRRLAYLIETSRMEKQVTALKKVLDAVIELPEVTSWTDRAKNDLDFELARTQDLLKNLHEDYAKWLKKNGTESAQLLP